MPRKPVNKAITAPRAVDATPATGGSTATAAAGNSVAVASTTVSALSVAECYALSIHARRAITAIAENAAKAELRVFARSTGDAIASGPLVDLLNRPSPGKTGWDLVRDCLSWWNIAGEMAIWAISDGLRPSQLEVLDPTRLSPDPAQAASPGEVTSWRYNTAFEFKGVVGILEIPADQVLFTGQFNPFSRLRGLSPLVTGRQAITTHHFATAYNAAFFQNGAHSDLVIRFPKGTKKQVATDWVAEWQARHGIHGGSAFKLAAFIGDEITVESLGDKAREGQFLELLRYDAAQVGALFGVPAILMGDLQSVKYDSVDAQLSTFFEHTLMPQMTAFTQFLQLQLVDRWFKAAPSGRKKIQPGLLLREQLTKALDTPEPPSEQVILLDADTLPFASTIILQRFAMLKEVREAADLSVMEAATYTGLDIPDSDLRRQVWVPSGRVRIDNQADTDAAVKALTQQVAGLTAVVKALAEPKPAPEPDPVVDLTALKGFYGEYRKLVLTSMAFGTIYPKSDALDLVKQHDLAGNPALVAALHADYLAFRAVLKDNPTPEARVTAAKALLNAAAKPAALRKLI